MRVFQQPLLLLRHRLVRLNEWLSGATEESFLLGRGSSFSRIAKAHGFAIFIVAIVAIIAVHGVLFFRIIVPTHLPSAPLDQFQPAVVQPPLAAPVQFQPPVAQPPLAAAVLSILRLPGAVMSALSSG